MELGTSTCLFSKRRDGSFVTHIEQTKRCAEAGFRVIDVNYCSATNPQSVSELLYDDWEARVDELGNLGASLGVKFTQSHAPYNAKVFTRNQQPTAEYMENFREMTRRSIIASGKLGVKWVVVHAINDTINTEYDMEIVKKTNVEFFSWMVELAKKCGTGIAIENMFNVDPKTYKRYYCVSPDDQIGLIDAFNDESVGACWDFGHASQVVRDQCRALKRLGSRLKATHVQDNNGKVDSHLVPFVGGNIAWEKIMPCLKEMNYSGDFVYECQSFMKDMPEELWPEAAKFAYDCGAYCMELYHNA